MYIFVTVLLESLDLTATLEQATFNNSCTRPATAATVATSE